MSISPPSKLNAVNLKHLSILRGQRFHIVRAICQKEIYVSVMWNVVTNVSLQLFVRISYTKWNIDSHINLFLGESRLYGEGYFLRLITKTNERLMSANCMRVLLIRKQVRWDGKKL
jgi:RAB protein geranylgeranyltransferase component A